MLKKNKSKKQNRKKKKDKKKNCCYSKKTYRVIINIYIKDFLKKFTPVIFIRVQCDREHRSNILLHFILFLILY
jgi:hypothetical protein